MRMRVVGVVTLYRRRGQCVRRPFSRLSFHMPAVVALIVRVRIDVLWATVNSPGVCSLVTYAASYLSINSSRSLDGRMGTLNPRRNRGSSKTGRAALCGTAFESQRASASRLGPPRHTRSSLPIRCSLASRSEAHDEGAGACGLPATCRSPSRSLDEAMRTWMLASVCAHGVETSRRLAPSLAREAPWIGRPVSVLC